MTRTPVDLTGQTFGAWTVIRRGSSSRSGSTRWECRCVCGKVSLVNRAHLLRGYSKSCGCQRARKHKVQRFRGCGETAYSNIRRRATAGYEGRKTIEFTVTIEYLWELFLTQNRQCAISGLPLTFAPTTSDKDRHQGNASLDRIDNTLGYIPGNVQWVHKHINYMKRIYDQPYFVELCKAVADHQRRQ